MVVKRQCSFCANEIEPGTGTLFVKRDGTVFSFCSSSCRKQQLHLGRVGHRLKWTRAHALKVASEQRSAPARARTPAPAGPTPPAAPEAVVQTPASEPVVSVPKPPPSEKAPRTPRTPKAKPSTEPKKASAGAEPAESKPAKSAKPRKPKAAAESSET
jgi:large subunit ribosomal protein L24e